MKKNFIIITLKLFSFYFAIAQENNPSIGIGTSLTGNFTSGNVLAIGDSDTGLKQMGDGELSIFTNNAERVRIDNSGKVGLGLFSGLKSRLNIGGDLFISIGEGFRLFGANNYFGGNIYDDAIIFEMQDQNSADGKTDGGFVFRGFTPKDGVNKDWMSIKTGGNVGIRTNKPITPLDVRGNISNGGTDFILGKFDSRDSGARTGNRALVHYVNDALHLNYAGDFEGGVVVDSNINVNGNLYMGGSNSWIFHTPDDGRKALYMAPVKSDGVSGDWENQFVFRENGSLGIGTYDPKNKLSVNGTIWATEVKVSLKDAADYVFEEDYKLLPLFQLEKFIKTEKHLPEIPSAKEFRENDLKVSEITNKLLQKIEELTLYTIKQEKKITHLESQNMELKELTEQLIVLTKRVSELEK